MKSHTMKGIAFAAAAFFALVALSAPANAGTLRNASGGGAGSVTGTLPGSVLWTYYDTCNTEGASGSGIPCTTGGHGDNILRLINPNGSGNSGIPGESNTPLCAQIYVLDDAQEMLACCGCTISSAGLLNLSVNHDLLSDPIVGGNPRGLEEGSIAIVATQPFFTDGDIGVCLPGNFPGYTASASVANLLGSITHNQIVANVRSGSTTGVTETSLFDDGNGDAANVTYLQNECSALVGNGTNGGFCSCPFSFIFEEFVAEEAAGFQP